MKIRTKIKTSKKIAIVSSAAERILWKFCLYSIHSTALHSEFYGIRKQGNGYNLLSHNLRLPLLSTAASSPSYWKENMSQAVVPPKITIPIIFSPHNPIYLWALRNKYPIDPSPQGSSAGKSNEKESIDYSFSIKPVSLVICLQRTLASGLCLLDSFSEWLSGSTWPLLGGFKSKKVLIHISAY